MNPISWSYIICTFKCCTNIENDQWWRTSSSKKFNEFANINRTWTGISIFWWNFFWPLTFIFVLTDFIERFSLSNKTLSDANFVSSVLSTIDLHAVLCTKLCPWYNHEHCIENINFLPYFPCLIHKPSRTPCYACHSLAK